MLDNKIYLLIIFLVTFIVVLVFYIIHKNMMIKIDNKQKQFALKTKCFVINLDRNYKRLHLFLNSYNNSDITAIELKRFSAIDGKTVDIKKYVTDDAFQQIDSAETNGYRLRHYELTRGAVGCFLSHTSLYNELVNDNDNDIYIIFEDDAKLPKQCISKIIFFIENAPADWDILLFGTIRQVISHRSPLYDKVLSWWGLYGYAINKKGANKFLTELALSGKIDKQIDSIMSYIVHEKKLNVYSSRIQFINHNADGTETDIQLPVRISKNIDPFKYGQVELFQENNEDELFQENNDNELSQE